jgi:hypothetical protein
LPKNKGEMRHHPTSDRSFESLEQMPKASSSQEPFLRRVSGALSKYRKQPHAKVPAAGMVRRKQVDTSGKSGAFLHDPAIPKTPSLRNHAARHYDCGSTSSPTIELGRPTAAIAGAWPDRALSPRP